MTQLTDAERASLERARTMLLDPTAQSGWANLAKSILEDAKTLAAIVLREHPAEAAYKPDCPYDSHSVDCNCQGTGGDR